MYCYCYFLKREKQSMADSDGTNGKAVMKPIIYFHTWRIGILFFVFGNCLNFISFGYAAQSLLAALGSVQFVSNIAFAFFVLNKTVTVKVLVATAFIVLGNVFLVAFGNHQSPVYTTEQLAEKYGNTTFLAYCLILVVVVILNHSLYRKGELLLILPGNDVKHSWHMLLPLSYAIVSGAVGSCSVLFAKSLSNLLRLSFSSDYQLHSWFTYSTVILFFSTAGFWMARLNEGLSLFDAILIVPMFQIVWTFFSICTGFVYFQEYQHSLSTRSSKVHNVRSHYLNLSLSSIEVEQVFDALRTTMFILGMISVFIGISLLAPDESRGGEIKDTALDSLAASHDNDVDRSVMPCEDSQMKDIGSLTRRVQMKAANMIVKIKAACSLSLGLGEESIHASSVLAMPMVSSKITGFRANGLDRNKLFAYRAPGWSRIDEDGEKLLQTTILAQNIK
ncbi:hypothetical protein STAS_23871 [Striga asiatica]|uniref:Probable magnesium transporter n=1 Tax=Striga asiatica TaxID=4170 RepID=A0A5A7QN84_STRAF|nr:hypothetical protein STAS_23871 [Striga asiatica]